MNKLIAIMLCLMAVPAFAGTCKISQYEQLATDFNGRIIPAAYEDGDTPTIEVTFTTSTASSAFAASTILIRIICDDKAHFKFGTNPTAVTTGPYLAQDAAEYFSVRAGASLKVAFVEGA